jgi:glycosyltransferase involved in cell wall biosynthesis
MRKVKVLHIITRLIRGGAEHNTLLTVIGLERLGYDVSLAAGPSDEWEGDIEKDARQAGVKLRLLHNLGREISPWNDLLTLLKLYFYIKKERFDIVHTHVSKAGILGRWAAKLAGVPIIVHTTHGNIFHGYFNSFFTKFFILLQKLTALITDKMITLTDIEKEQWLNQGIGKSTQYTAILSGIDLKRFNPENVQIEPYEMRKKLGLHTNDFVIGTVGRIVPIKGHKYFIQAAAEVIREIPNAKVLLVGDGPIRNEMEELTVQLGIEGQVFFLGVRKDVPELLSIMDLFVLPSLNEGMGRALVEAMAMGLPVIASQVGGVPEVVTDGKTGILVPAQNPTALAKAIVKLARDAKLSRELAQAGYKRAHSAFGAETMVDRISAVYQELLAEGDAYDPKAL